MKNSFLNFLHILSKLSVLNSLRYSEKRLGVLACMQDTSEVEFSTKIPTFNNVRRLEITSNR